MIDLNAANFDAFVTKPVALVDFSSTRCGPCRVLAPLLTGWAAKAGLPLGKVDCDENPDLAVRFGVSAIPTVLFFRAGTEIRRTVGLFDEAGFTALTK